MIPFEKLIRMSVDEQKELQNSKLRRLMREQLPFSEFYRGFFKKYGLSFSDIKTTDDLVRLPFTVKKDIAPDARDPERPKKFILIPSEKLIKKFWPKSKLLLMAARKFFSSESLQDQMEYNYKPIHLHLTAGRTALPTPFFYTSRDVQLMWEAGERLIKIANFIHPRDVVISAFPFAPHLGFYHILVAMWAGRVLSFHTGGGRILGTANIIKTIEKFKATAVITMPGYGYHLLRQALDEKADFSAIRQIILGGERVSDEQREKLREMLKKLSAKNPKIMTGYGFTEAKVGWFQCHEKSGYHYFPDIDFIEVVDKKGDRVKEGEPGELVYTPLESRGTVVVRYRTGDLVKWVKWGPCPYCGRNLPSISREIDRVSDIKEFHLKKIRGQWINMNVLFSLIGGYREVDEWQVEIRKKNNDPYELDEFVVYLAPRSLSRWNVVSDEIKKRLRDVTGLTPTVIKKSREEILKRLGLETELKEKRIIDSRPK
jgi:phenylacetate-CoA ligase